MTPAAEKAVSEILALRALKEYGTSSLLDHKAKSSKRSQMTFF